MMAQTPIAVDLRKTVATSEIPTNGVAASSVRQLKRTTSDERRLIANGDHPGEECSDTILGRQ
jgi:hypothetical protein